MRRIRCQDGGVSERSRVQLTREPVTAFLPINRWQRGQNEKTGGDWLIRV